MIEKTKLKITTITPVTIGSGAELSPYSDYVIGNNEVCFIDKTKLQNIIATNDRWLDDYVQGVAMGMEINGNNRSEFDLQSFLLNNKIVKTLDEVISYRCPLITNTPLSKLPIKGIVKSPLQEPYFPGSSLKGALKTVLMYNWLKTNKNSDRTIEKVIYDGNFNFLEKEFEAKVDEVTNLLVHPNTIQQITDSSRISKDSIVVVDCYRKMPIRFECIAKGNTSEFELTLADYKWEDLAKQANKYAEDVLNREFELIGEDKKMTNYYNHLVDIEDKISEANDNIAYFRIGFGKGYYLNSLGIAIYDYVCQNGKKDLYDRFEDFIIKQFAKRGHEDDVKLDNFPKTRLFVSKTQEPLGWVKIEKM
jgi:CRISPR-associated protein Csm5